MSALGSDDMDYLVPHLFKRQRFLDGIVHAVAILSSILLLLLALGIGLQLYHASMPSMKAFGWHFLWDLSWNPVTEQFGALAPIVGTIITSFIALLLGIPLSFGIALFLTELSPRSL